MRSRPRRSSPRSTQKMAALPGELEALRKTGADEVAAEEARIRQAAEAERARLIEQSTREIDCAAQARRARPAGAMRPTSPWTWRPSA